MSPKRSSFFLLVLSLLLVLVSCAAPEPLSFSLSIEVTPENSGTIVEGEGENHIVGSDVNVKVEPKTGYDFVNWTNSNGDVLSENQEFTYTMPEKNVVLTANFSLKEYTVTFDGNGGTPETQTVNVEHGNSIDTLPTVSKNSHLMVEWNTQQDGLGTTFTTDTPINNDITLYAIWVESYTVTFNGNGGTPETQTFEVEKGKTIDTLPSVEKTGYSLDEWNSNQDGTGNIFDTSTVVNDNMNVYAIWNINSYEVATSVSPENSGEITETATYVYNSTVTLSATPNQTYSFINWVLPEGVSLDSGYTVEDSTIEFTMIAEDINVEAVFEGEFTGGDGSSNDPYLISTVNNLNNVRNYLDANYKLTSNIDLNSVENWEPIGDDIDSFTGSFDGGDYTISNVNIESNKNHIGFFGYTSEDASVTNMTLDNLYINGSPSEWNNAIGGLIGENYGYVSNSNVQVIMSDITGKTGGLIGKNYGLIENTSSNASITSFNNSASIGGLVGWNEGIGYSTFYGIIKNSHSTGEIQGTGIIGGLVYLNKKGGIEKSYSTVDIKGYNEAGYSKARVGGFVAINSGSITKSYSTGNVYGDDYAGGFVGYNQSTGKIEESFALGSVYGNDNTGGFVGKNEGKIENTYAYNDTIRGNTHFTGGFAGITETTSSIKESYVINDVTSTRYAGPFSNNADGTYEDNYFYADFYDEDLTTYRAKGLTSEQMKKARSFDFISPYSSIWEIDEGNSYPYFTWQEETSHNYPE